MAMEVVNGYVCRNCTDVEYAKKGVDPAHPKDGPQGAYANGKADKPGASEKRAERGPAVVLDGQLASVNAGSPDAPRPAYAPGATVNVAV